MHQPTVTLHEEQIAFFQRNGYLVLPAITTAAEVEQLQGIKAYKLFSGHTVGQAMAD